MSAVKPVSGVNATAGNLPHGGKPRNKDATATTMIKHHVPASSAGQSRWIQVVTRLPSRARCPCSGAGQEAGADGVADLALERTAGLARCAGCRRLTPGNLAPPATSHVHAGQISQALPSEPARQPPSPLAPNRRSCMHQTVSKRPC